MLGGLWLLEENGFGTGVMDMVYECWEGHRGAAGRVYCGTTGRGPSGKIRTGALLEDKDPSVELFVEGVELFVEGD
ncbi:hypothetical protein V6N13_009487 [Hibiscus sabdariffa]